MSYRISKEFDAQRSLKVQQCIIVQVHAPASIPHAARVGESRPRTLASPLPLGPPPWLSLTLADSCPTPAVTLRRGGGSSGAIASPWREHAKTSGVTVRAQQWRSEPVHP